MAQCFMPNAAAQVATCKLGFTLTKHGKAMIEWASSCEPNSIFSNMPKSQQTLTYHVSEMADFIQTEIQTKIQASQCWGIQMDESTDKGDFPQTIIYARFVNMVRCCIETKFLTILRVEGSPNAKNLYRTLNIFVQAENYLKKI